MGKDPRFASVDEVDAYYREIYTPFGNLTEAQWRHIAEHSVRRLDGGGFALHYDPAIGAAFQTEDVDDVDLWQIWDAVRCPVLVLHGADSDILPAAVAEEMGRRGPKADVVDFPGIGHTPMLMSDDQIRIVRQWLEA